MLDVSSHLQRFISFFVSLFELCPDAKLLFGFPLNVDPQSGALLKNARFIKHATFLLSMIEKAVGMLGQDDAELTETLLDLGRKHVTYGVRPEYFPFMTKAIIKMMKEILGGEFTAEDEEAWNDILSLFIADIVRGERMLDMGLAATHKKITDTNWAKLKEIEDYDEVAGMVVFRK
jgi:Globin